MQVYSMSVGSKDASNALKLRHSVAVEWDLKHILGKQINNI